MSEKIAIIGGGMAGLTAAYLLNDKYNITLFEKENRIGGNMYTLNTSDGHEFDVSIFFFNKKTYPNFFKLLKKLGCNKYTFPLTGASMTLFNLDSKETRFVNLDFFEKIMLKRLSITTQFVLLNVMINIKRGLDKFENGEFEGLTMEQSMDLIPQLKGDTKKLICFPLCLMASMHYHEFLSAPAAHFWGKIDEHFGSIGKAFSWRLIECKTQTYIDAMSCSYKDKIVLNSDIKSIERKNNKVILKNSDGTESTFDHVIFACYADQALKLLENPTDEEKRILGAWRYNDGLVVVHKDMKHFPEKDLLSMYEYLYTERDGEIQTSINASYGYQRGVADDCGYLGTQYPNIEIDEELIELSKVFRTPIYDDDSRKMIKEIPSLNGKMNTYYCGSHFGYGLHEDAVTSAIEAAKLLGVEWK